MAIILKIFFLSIIIWFIGFLISPIIGFLVVIKNTIIWGLSSTSMIGYLGCQAVIFFISAIMFLGIFNLVKGST